MNNDLLSEMIDDKYDLYANNTYIMNGIFLLTKKYVKNEILKNYVYRPDMVDKAIKLIPYRKGEEVDLISVGTQCELSTNERIIIPITDKYAINYDYVKKVIKYYQWEFPYFTWIHSKKFIGVKFWGENDTFLGAICAIDRKEI